MRSQISRNIKVKASSMCIDEVLNLIIDEVKQLDNEFNLRAKEIEAKYNVKLIIRTKNFPINVCIDAHVDRIKIPQRGTTHD